MRSNRNPYQPPLAESEIPIAPEAKLADDGDLGYLLMAAKVIIVTLGIFMLFFLLVWWIAASWNVR